MGAFFKWNGISSATYGIYVSAYPPLTLAQERVKYEQVPGRSGSLAVLEGPAVYDDVTLTIPCVIRDIAQISAIGAWLKGGGKLELGNRAGGYYDARIVNQIPFETIMRGRSHRAFSVAFRCKPYWYANGGATAITLTAPGGLNNPGNTPARPLIRVNGSGDIRLMVGAQTIELEGVSSYITLDSELMEAYRGTALQNDKMFGEFPTLAPGAVPISWTGTVTSVVVTPRWRYLQ